MTMPHCIRRLTTTVALAAMAMAMAISFEAAASQSHPPPPPETPLVAQILPVAAGALVGTAVGFFIVPVLVPSVAVVATVGPPTSPMFGAIGAGLGALVGMTQAPK